jgi:hypothetical protein
VDKFAKKMLLGAVSFGLAIALMAGALSAVYFHNRPPRCSESIVFQAESPDKQWVADAYERRCTDPGEWLAHVNLRRKADPIRINHWYGYRTGMVNQGEVFLIEQDGEGQAPELEWTAPDRLTIRCAKCKRSALRRDDRWGPVSIRYEVGKP